MAADPSSVVEDAKAQLAEAKLRATQLAEAKLRASQLAESLMPVMHQSEELLEAPQLSSAEERRQEEREKRKALWESAPNAFEDIGDRSRPTANAWENIEALGSGAQRNKFLRLMGGRVLAKTEDGPPAQEKDDESDSEEFEVADGCEVVELFGGEFVQVIDDDSHLAEEPGKRKQPSDALNEDLEQQFERERVRQTEGGRREGIGAG
eukprot:TRINITY_DN95745_c0_g1_i1.p1 TRINITY_DN95745_c0_g1~~TRINITY_DN95745_c0_g1_i1.p1  ORF type:complete len:208 (+),score=53.31 TRINITY_DN95745_c0_g1_i1:89-712(+)